MSAFYSIPIFTKNSKIQNILCLYVMGDSIWNMIPSDTISYWKESYLTKIYLYNISIKTLKKKEFPILPWNTVKSIFDIQYSCRSIFIENIKEIFKKKKISYIFFYTLDSSNCSSSAFIFKKMFYMIKATKK